MGIELSVLKKNVGNFIIISPYTEDKIPDEQWEIYYDEDGNEVELSKEWREIKFRCHYPTNDRLKRLSSFMAGSTHLSGQGLVIQSDVEAGVEYIVNNIIVDVKDITSEGQRLEYTKKQSSKGMSSAKEVIKDQFLKSGLLLSGFMDEYRSQAGKLKGKSKTSSEESEDSYESNSDAKHGMS